MTKVHKLHSRRRTLDQHRYPIQRGGLVSYWVTYLKTSISKRHNLLKSHDYVCTSRGTLELRYKCS